MQRDASRPEPKLRGIPRRMRSLRKWAHCFKGTFPSQSEIEQNSRYWNWKLPTYSLMVEGKQSTLQMKREVAQILIDACGHLIDAKPAWANQLRVTCVLCFPDMFTSELCIYVDENYFNDHMEIGSFSNGVTASDIQDRSLAREWSLELPAGVFEVGRHVEFKGYEDGLDAFSGERWHYGEVNG